MSRAPRAPEALLVRELTGVYDRVNEERFEGVLRRPVISLSSRSVELGRWTSATRTLELSEPLVRERAWCEVVAVLEHEMAHQYVDEVLAARGETAHGATFQRVCAERGIDARARGDVSAAPVEEPKVVRRIRKLLALADSPEPAEARAAAAKAYALMIEHQVGVVARQEVPRFIVRQAGEVRARWPKHDSLLAGLLSAHFFVQVTGVPAVDAVTGKRGRALELAGRAENVEIAGYVFDVVRQAGEEAWRRRGEPNAGRRRFLEGFVLGYRDQLLAEAARAEERGLVLRADAGLADFVQRRFPRGLRKRGARVRDDDHHRQGRDAGRRLVVRKPIATRGEAIVGMLKGPRGQG